MLRVALAVLHLLALGIGTGAVYARARALHRVAAAPGGVPNASPAGGGADPGALARAFAADAWWGVAALLWLGTGLWRALAGTEKAPAYYWANHVFYAKMTLFAAVFALELWPMVTLVRWRAAAGRGTLPAPAALAPAARRIARLSDVQLLLLVGIVTAAVLMARGYGAR